MKFYADKAGGSLHLMKESKCSLNYNLTSKDPWLPEQIRSYHGDTMALTKWWNALERLHIDWSCPVHVQHPVVSYLAAHIMEILWPLRSGETLERLHIDWSCPVHVQYIPLCHISQLKKAPGANSPTTLVSPIVVDIQWLTQPQEILWSMGLDAEHLEVLV